MASSLYASFPAPSPSPSPSPSAAARLGMSLRFQPLSSPCFPQSLGVSPPIASAHACLHAKNGRLAPSFRGVRTARTLRLMVVRAKRSSVDAGERVLAAVGYLLPLLDGLQYGRYFFLQFPAAQVVIKPLFPLLEFYRSVPYASFVAFFTLYLAVVRNPNLSRYVRFNTMQAVVLDVLLILPNLVERMFTPRSGIGFNLLVIFYNTVFLYLVACFLFGTISCMLGRIPRLPLVADAADAQVL